MQLDQNSITKLQSFFKEQSAVEPIIDETTRSIRIKSYTVEKQNREWTVSTKNRVIHCFAYRSWALAWVVAAINNDISTCDYLIKNNKHLDKLKLDKTLYQYYQNNTNPGFRKNRVINNRISTASQHIDELVDDTHQVLRYQGFV